MQCRPAWGCTCPLPDFKPPVCTTHLYIKPVFSLYSNARHRFESRVSSVNEDCEVKVCEGQSSLYDEAGGRFKTSQRDGQ